MSPIAESLEWIRISISVRECLGEGPDPDDRLFKTRKYMSELTGELNLSEILADAIGKVSVLPFITIAKTMVELDGRAEREAPEVEVEIKKMIQSAKQFIHFYGKHLTSNSVPCEVRTC